MRNQMKSLVKFGNKLTTKTRKEIFLKMTKKKNNLKL